MNQTSQQLRQRLNEIPDKILAKEFLKSQGLGNEIGFWIFDYAPEAEIEVREYVTFLENMLNEKHAHLSVVNINLLKSLVGYLGDRNMVEKALKMQAKKGEDLWLHFCNGPLHMDKFAPYLVESSQAADRDIIFITGIGSVWPLLRAHNLLNSLHSLLGHKPVVLFYPGHYDGQTMSLFNRIPSNNYYRAFKLVP